MRLLGAVVAGYVTIFLGVFLVLSGAYLTLGPDRAFESGTYDVTLLWIVVYLVVSIAAALLGGAVVARVSTDRRAPMVLAGFIFIMGIASAVSEGRRDPNGVEYPRSADVPNMQAMMQARTPTWMLFLTPIIGAVGVLMGARRRAP